MLLNFIELFIELANSGCAVLRWSSSHLQYEFLDWPDASLTAFPVWFKKDLSYLACCFEDGKVSGLP